MVVTALVLLRSSLSQLVGVLLVTLLWFTTPVGTGQGVHSSALLHPVLPHVHLLDGVFVTDEQLAAARAFASAERLPQTPTSGIAVGAGSGADAASAGLALGPTLPEQVLSVMSFDAGRLAAPTDTILPPEFRDPPQDPPPNPIV
jgi:hypothetical protein